MLTIGIVGGMSWLSSAQYYRTINGLVQSRCGGLESARIVMYSLNFTELCALQQIDDWEGAATLVARAAVSVESGGADFLLLACSTMYCAADRILEAVTIPLLHIVPPTVTHVKSQHLERVGLLGTIRTMGGESYRLPLAQHGIDLLVPANSDQLLIQEMIFREMALGALSASSRQTFLQVVERLAARGAQGVILGCTEMGLFFRPAEASVPLLDCGDLHARIASRIALGDQELATTMLSRQRGQGGSGCDSGRAVPHVA